jgi:HK97 family phage prohead protease
MIHVILGAPCSGKSTYVREHMKDGDIRVDFDMIADCFGNNNKHEAEGYIKDCAFAVRETAISYLLDHKDAEGWIIHTKPTGDQMKAYQDAEADIVTMDTPMDVCLERAAADGRPQRSIDAIYEYFEGQKGVTRLNLKTKTFEIKAESNGSISGYASTWTREPDSYGDVVAKGAFLDSITQIKDENRVLPLLWNHDSNTLNNYIGTVTDLEEDDHGLKFSAVFDDTAEAQRARQLASDGRLCKFSFAYDVLDQAEVELEDGRKANELRKLNIHEVSLVLYPANPDTSVIEVKSEGDPVEYAKRIVNAIHRQVQRSEKSGRRNSAKDEDKLRQAISLLQDVLGEMEQPDNDPEDKPEDQDTDNGEDQKRKSRLIDEANKLLKGE